MSHLTHNM